MKAYQSNILKVSMLLLIMLSLLFIPLITVRTVTAEGVETCDSNLTDWQGGQIQLVNGQCLPVDGAQFDFKREVNDFTLSFDARLEPGSKIKLILASMSYYRIEFEITTKNVNLTGYIFGGNATSEERFVQLMGAALDLPDEQMHQFEIQFNHRRAELTVDGKLVDSSLVEATREIPRLVFMGNVAFDNLLLNELPFASSSYSIKDFDPAIIATYIAFTDQNQQIWLIHPDGSGLKPLAGFAVGSQMQFSPDGKFLAYVNDAKLYLVDIATNQLLAGWQGDVNVGNYSWSSDGHILIQGDDYSPNFAEYDPESPAPITVHIIPQAIDDSGFRPDWLNAMVSSPTERFLLLSLSGKIGDSQVNRYVVYSLDEGKINVLPGDMPGIWSADGTKIIVMGAELQFPSLKVTEISKERSSIQNFSPNGQFGSYSPTYAGEIVIINLSDGSSIGGAPSDIQWAPDSRHFVYRDNGRITVQSLLTGTFVYLALGYSMIWQPSPDITRTAGLVSLATPLPSPNPTSLTTESAGAFTNPQSTSKAVNSESISDQKNGQIQAAKPFPIGFPIIIIIVGILVAGGAGYLIFRPASIKCANCGTSNPKTNKYCDHCGKPLMNASQPIQKFDRRMVNRIAYFGVALLGVGSILLVIDLVSGSRHVPSNQNQLSLIATAEPNPEITYATEFSPTQIPTQNAAAVNGECYGLNIQKDKLVDAYTKIIRTMKDKTELPTPSYDPANAGDPTQMAAYMSMLSPTCALGDIVFSPNGKWVLLTEVALSDQVPSMVLYEVDSQNVVWVTNGSTSADQIIWSPDGKSMGIRHPDGWQIIDLSTGGEKVFINDSSRTGTWPVAVDSEKKIMWRKDDTLLRKIQNAVQVIDAKSGNILEEIPTDDSLMGTSNPEGRITPPTFAFAWSPDGDQFVTLGGWPITESGGAGSPNTSYYPLRMWDVQSGKLVWEQRVGLGMYGWLAWSPRGDRIAIIAPSQRTVFVDAAVGTILPETVGGLFYNPDCLWSPNGTVLTSRDDLGKYQYFFLFNSGSTVQLDAPENYSISAVGWLSDGRLLVKATQQQGLGYYEYLIASSDGSSWTKFEDAKLSPVP